MARHVSRRDFVSLTSIIVAGLIIFALEHLWTKQQSTHHETINSPVPSTGSHPARCRDVKGSNETLVVLKTGAGEMVTKLPVHLRTTLTCFPNYLVFSDHQEIYEGVSIINALDTVSADIRQNHEDFALYRTLQDGRSALNEGEEHSSSVLSAGSPENPGWKLDKWKFLPMLDQTYLRHPEMKWYMFVETDTSMLWATLLRFSQELDHTQPYYLGAQNWIGDVEFAHGGSGFLVSNAALRAAVELYRAQKEEWEKFTDGHWAGDCIAGKAFKESGAPLTRAWPIIQGDHPGDFPWGEAGPQDEPRWCFPTTTYHHTGPDVVEELWNFEQDWIAAGGLESERDYLLYRDVFEGYIMPRMQDHKVGWDNQSKDDLSEPRDLESCIEACQRDEACLQYRFDSAAGQCMVSSQPKLGKAAAASPELHSGWMIDRIQEWALAMPPCPKPLWITSNT